MEGLVGYERAKLEWAIEWASERAKLERAIEWVSERARSPHLCYRSKVFVCNQEVI